MSSGYRNAIIGAVLGAAFTSIAWLVSGPTLGLLLSGVFAAIVLVPLLDATKSIGSRLIVSGSITHAIASMWIICAITTSMTILDVAQGYLILQSISAALLGFRLIRVHPQLVAFAGIAWFASPVFLANVMSGTHGDGIVSILTQYHPLFSLNRVLIDQGAWTSSGFAYQHLTPLGQDVSYILPASIWRCVMAHALLAAGCAMIFAASGRRDQTAIARC